MDAHSPSTAILTTKSNVQDEAREAAQNRNELSLGCVLFFLDLSKVCVCVCGGGGGRVGVKNERKGRTPLVHTSHTHTHTHTLTTPHHHHSCREGGQVTTRRKYFVLRRPLHRHYPKNMKIALTRATTIFILLLRGERGGGEGEGLCRLSFVLRGVKTERERIAQS